jgi:serine/threonine-protein kinase
MTQSAYALEGQTIEGRYHIVRKIADGGMATVYEAVDQRLERTVALKVMHMQLAQGPHRDEFIERFHREAKSAAAISNPHIVQVYDTGEIDGLAFLVMEYVHGVNLRYDMNQQHTFSVKETVRVISQTLEGLSAAHSVNVVHRDIKPENILLNDRGHVQITDFGLAKVASQATVSSTGMLLGTAAYLAPEVIENNQATLQGDLYSVGIMAWEMLAGVVPFASSNPVTIVFKHVHEDVPDLRSICPQINADIAGFIAHLTARDITQRPRNAQAALDELRECSTHLSIDDWRYRREWNDSSSSQNSGQSVGNGQHSSSKSTLAPPPPAPAVNGGTKRTTVVDSSTPQARDHDTRLMPKQRQASNRSSWQGPSQGEQATQSIGAMEARSLSEDTSQHESELKNTGKKNRKKPLIIITAILLVLAIAGGTTGWWYYRGSGSYWLMPKPTDITCSANDTSCTVTNTSWKSFESTLKVANIPYRTNKAYSDTVAQGDIISTSPANVGDHISKRDGSVVTVTISQGIKQATIPKDIADPTSTNGKDPLAALKRAGFDNISHDTSQDEYSQVLPGNAVQSISPEPGTTMNHNKKITIALSKGPMPVSMPDIVGRTKDEVETAFSDAKLTANYTEEFSDTVASGSVISASVKPGAQLHWGDSVDVVLSKGPETVTLPDVRGTSTSEAKKTLEALGLEVKVSAPLGDLTHTVRLQSPDPGQQVRVRDEDGNATVITLTIV